MSKLVTNDDATKKIIDDLYRGVLLDMVCAEECGELIQAISKYVRKPSKETKTNLIEEMADVTICINALMVKYDIPSDEVQSVIEYKNKRNLKRMAKRN